MKRTNRDLFDNFDRDFDRTFNRDLFDNFDRDFDRTFNRAAKGIGIAWVIGAILTLAFWALVAWGIYELVIWVTSK